MLHIRLTTPSELTKEVVPILKAATSTTHLVVIPGAVYEPHGDLIEFDLAREAANPMLDELRALGVGERGSISVERVDFSISAQGKRAEEVAPGYDDDAVVWDELRARTRADARMSWVFLVFLALATQIAAIGALLDQPILIVGAMVLGPEFGVIAAICFGVIGRDFQLIGKAGRSLLVGFGLAIAITTICAATSRLWGWVEPEMLENRQLTTFIFHPDHWSFIVAVLAGIAGILSITAGKSSPLVGVFISVTTVPAAGNIAIAIAVGNWREFSGSAIQLGVNLAGMLIAGVLTLLVQQTVWKTITRLSARRIANRQMHSIQ